MSLTLSPTVVATLVAVVVGFVGARATVLDSWYRELRKPSWQPPDWAFGPGWTTIYIFCVWSVSVFWPAATESQRTTYLLAWGVNIALNVWWSLLFFRQRRPDWALREVVLLWLSIASVVLVSYPASPRAAMLLLPYLLWVSFSSTLNAAVVKLNAPFTRT